MGGPLEGKRALIVGIANEESIAWGIASALRQAGADLCITYLNAKAEQFVRPLADSLQASIVAPLDVSDHGQELALFETLSREWGRLDVLIHSIAFAPRADLHGRVVDVSAEGFAKSMDVSVHSFIRLCHLAEPLMNAGGTCLTMSFFGAERVVSTYNVMGPVKSALEATARELATELGARGITVNVLSPGPIATRAAGGIAEFDEMMSSARSRAPLKRLATISDVGSAAVFLASESARAITGETLHIDCGTHIVA